MNIFFNSSIEWSLFIFKLFRVNFLILKMIFRWYRRLLCFLIILITLNLKNISLPTITYIRNHILISIWFFLMIGFSSCFRLNLRGLVLYLLNFMLLLAVLFILLILMLISRTVEESAILKNVLTQTILVLLVVFLSLFHNIKLIMISERINHMVKIPTLT